LAQRAEAAAPKLRSNIGGLAHIKYVYILQSVAFPDKHYVGITDDLRARLPKHNAGEVPHTSKYKPWRIKTYLAFSDEKRAIEIFEIGLRAGICEETIVA